MAAEASQALHVLDRFHITTHLNQAVDQVRRARAHGCGPRQGRSAAAQTHALAVVAPGQPGTWAGPAKTAAVLVSKLATARGLGAEGDVSTSLALPIPALGQNLSRLLVLSGHAQPSGADEESRPHAPRP